MQWLIDHIAAVIIGASVIFLLAVLQMRGGHAAIDALQYSTSRVASTTLTDVLEQDVTNIGAGLLSVEEAQITIDTTSETRSFAFWTRTNRQNASPARVEYRWKEEGTVVLADDPDVPTYQISRLVNGLETEITGNIVTAIEVRLRDDQMVVIHSDSPGALATTRRVDISLRLVSPLGAASVIEETRWQRQIMPPNLRRASGPLIIGG